MIAYILIVYLILVTSVFVTGCATVDHTHSPVKCPEPKPLAYVLVAPEGFEPYRVEVTEVYGAPTPCSSVIIGNDGTITFDCDFDKAIDEAVREINKDPDE